LKALDALRDLVGLPAVRDALLETLQRDRIRACASKR